MNFVGYTVPTDSAQDGIHPLLPLPYKRPPSVELEDHLYKWKVPKLSPASTLLAQSVSRRFSSTDMARTISTPPMFMSGFQLPNSTVASSVISPSLLQSPASFTSPQLQRVHADTATLPDLTHSGTTLPSSVSGIHTRSRSASLQHASIPQSQGALHDLVLGIPASHVSSDLLHHRAFVGLGISSAAEGTENTINKSSLQFEPQEKSRDRVLQDITELNESEPDSQSADSSKASQSPLRCEPRVMINGHRLASLPPSIQILMHRSLRFLLTNDNQYKLSPESARTLHDAAPWFTSSVVEASSRSKASGASS
ncbi:hypothetical protein ACM66B_004905 [Microbotryomycetes sp. NB124-2]